MRALRIIATGAALLVTLASGSASSDSNRLEFSTPDGLLSVLRDSVAVEHKVTYTPKALVHLASDEKPWDVELGFQRTALAGNSDRYAAVLKCCGRNFHGMHEIVLKVGNSGAVSFLPTDGDVHFFHFFGMYRTDTTTGGTVCIPDCCETVDLPVSITSLAALGDAHSAAILIISAKGDTLSAPLGWDHLQLARLTAKWWESGPTR